MPIRQDLSTDTEANVIMVGGQALTMQYAGIQFPPGSADAIEAVRANLQFQLDNRMQIKDLPRDDPERDSDPVVEYSDPAKARRFWNPPGTEGGGKPNDFLVHRSILVSVTWDGTKYSFGFERLREG